MKNVYYIFIAISLCLISCNDKYLDRFPIDSPSDATFWSNEGELTLASNGCYKTLQNLDMTGPVPFFLIFDNMSDIAWSRSASGYPTPLANGTVTPTFATLLTIWKDFYSGISSCNLLLKNMDRAKENTDPEIYKRIGGEAKFLRAFYYFYLSELWGGVPLITEPLNLKESQIAKSSKKEVTDFIINELTQAAVDLPVKYGANDVGRATKGAALALLSRVALYNENWDVAIQAAQDVMNLNVYQLFPDYLKLFYYTNENSVECIFDVQYTLSGVIHTLPRRIGSRNAGGTSELIPLQALVDSYDCIDGLPIDKSPLYNPLHPELNRDPRLNYTVAMSGTSVVGYQFETHPDSLTCWNYNINPPQRINNQDVTNPYASFSGYVYRKFYDPTDVFDNAHSSLNFMLIRYAEVLLNYAEAKIEKGDIDQSVYDAINKVRQRPSVNMIPIELGQSQSKMRSIIRKERKSELALEGLRYFDIRRWKIAENVMNGPTYGRPKVPGTPSLLLETPNIDEWGTPDYSSVSNKKDLRILDNRVFNKDRDYLWPIPQREIDANENLEQNPNW